MSLPEDHIRGTGTYFNRDSWAWEAWVHDIASGEKTLLGECEKWPGVSDEDNEYRKQIWERKVWSKVVDAVVFHTNENS